MNRRARRKPLPTMPLLKPGAPPAEGLSADRAQHCAVESAVGFQDERHRMFVARAVQAPIERYEARGSITRRQYEAAVRFRTDYELGVVGARDPEAKGTGTTGGYSEARLIAVESWQRGVRALGKRLSGWIITIVCIEQDASAAGARVGLSVTEVMAFLRLGLEMLGDHYGLAGGTPPLSVGVHVPFDTIGA